MPPHIPLASLQYYSYNLVLLPAPPFFIVVQLDIWFLSISSLLLDSILFYSSAILLFHSRPLPKTCTPTYTWPTHRTLPIFQHCTHNFTTHILAVLWSVVSSPGLLRQGRLRIPTCSCTHSCHCPPAMVEHLPVARNRQFALFIRFCVVSLRLPPSLPPVLLAWLTSPHCVCSVVVDSLPYTLTPPTAVARHAHPHPTTPHPTHSGSGAVLCGHLLPCRVPTVAVHLSMTLPHYRASALPLHTPTVLAYAPTRCCSGYTLVLHEPPPYAGDMVASLLNYLITLHYAHLRATTPTYTPAFTRQLHTQVYSCRRIHTHFRSTDLHRAPAWPFSSRTLLPLPFIRAARWHSACSTTHAPASSGTAFPPAVHVVPTSNCFLRFPARLMDLKISGRV